MSEPEAAVVWELPPPPKLRLPVPLPPPRLTLSDEDGFGFKLRMEYPLRGLGGAARRPVGRFMLLTPPPEPLPRERVDWTDRDAERSACDRLDILLPLSEATSSFSKYDPSPRITPLGG